MAKTNGSGGPIIIKKYANRRLYDTSTSSYVTLDHLSDLVREGRDFEVRDAKTGDHLTRQVLTQIIFEQETKGQGALPLNFLRQLIGFYGGGAQTFLPAFKRMSDLKGVVSGKLRVRCKNLKLSFPRICFLLFGFNQVISGRNLPATDFTIRGSTSDPFAQFAVDGKLYKTEVANATIVPNWNAVFEMYCCV